MSGQVELDIVRRAYARQIRVRAGVSEARAQDAFAQVHREPFLGPGPRRIVHAFGGHIETPDADPVYAYVNQPVAIIPQRRIHNGQPTLHALLRKAAAIASGTHVVHVGAGTGYYSAIMALLAGDAGRVTAIASDTGLAARA